MLTNGSPVFAQLFSLAIKKGSRCGDICMLRNRCLNRLRIFFAWKIRNTAIPDALMLKKSEANSLDTSLNLLPDGVINATVTACCGCVHFNKAKSWRGERSFAFCTGSRSSNSSNVSCSFFNRL